MVTITPKMTVMVTRERNNDVLKFLSDARPQSFYRPRVLRDGRLTSYIKIESYVVTVRMT